MTDKHLSDLTASELFARWAAIMRELRRRGLVRSERAPVADYAEALVAQHFGVPVERHGAHPGYDLRLSDGRRVQVKCRRRTAASTPSHFGDFSDLDPDPFDLFVGVLFDEDFNVLEARMTTIDRVRSLVRPVHGRQRLTISALRADASAQSLDLRALQTQ